MKSVYKTIKTEELNCTSNSYVYNRILQNSFYCERCSAGHRHNGSLYHHPIRSWKHHRKTQYRE